jgi:hypothetical protein
MKRGWEGEREEAGRVEMSRDGMRWDEVISVSAYIYIYIYISL